jgi:hypothetical protein
VARQPLFAIDSRSTMRPVWTAGLVIAATAALYWPSLSAGFVGDDFMILHRLRATHGADVLRFFRTEFFEFYRPLGFLSHAVDWRIGGGSPVQFHSTNVLLHVVNAVLLLQIGRALSPGSPAGLIAALLFAIHPSNTEAVFWMSARFDLLATCFSLAATYCVVRGGWIEWFGPVLFVAAVLSKESAVALPIAVAGWWTAKRGASTVTTIVRLVPWLGALALYAILRQLGGGVSAMGGSSRLPKLVALALGVITVVLLADGRWQRARDWARERRSTVAGLGGMSLVVLALAAAFSHGSLGALAREKLAVAAFALFCLASPVLDVGEASFSDPGSALSWTSGLVALAVAALVVFSLWRRLLDDERMWFLGALLFSTLLPISALTDGKRYLYLPSTALAIAAGTMVGELAGRARRTAFAFVGALLLVSAIQIEAKGRDWIWAGKMTADGSRLVDAALMPQCGTGDVVFLTSPVGVRGVYTHFYYETFELSRGCQPERFQVVARVARFDSPIEVHWTGPRTIEITTHDYRGNFLLSRDLRNFDVPLRRGQNAVVRTPIGEVNAEPRGSDMVLHLTLSPEVDPDKVLFYYYADGTIRTLPREGRKQAQRSQPAQCRTPPATASTSRSAAAARGTVPARQAQAPPRAARTTAAG